MAALTGRAELSAMLITMATAAVLRQAEKRFGRAHIGIVGELLLNILYLMALPAGGLRMFAFQHVTGLPVIEISLALLPKD